MLYITSKNSGLELAPSTELGDGALFLHSYGITFNGQAKVGKNLTKCLKALQVGNNKMWQENWCSCCRRQCIYRA